MLAAFPSNSTLMASPSFSENTFIVFIFWFLLPYSVSLRKDRASPRSVSLRLRGSRTRIEGIRKPLIRVSREAVEICLNRNTKRGKRCALSSAKCRLFETLYISRDDRFAALQIVYAAGRCPPMYRLVADCLSFHLQFTV